MAIATPPMPLKMQVMIEMDIVMGLIMILHTIGELTFHTFTTTMAHIFHVFLLTYYFRTLIGGFVIIGSANIMEE